VSASPDETWDAIRRKWKLGRTQIKVLRFLSESGEMLDVRAIAKGAGVSHSAAYAALRRMRAKGVPIGRQAANLPPAEPEKTYAVVLSLRRAEDKS
jgi:DNA-binding Lrp family transcriptional regulator